MTLVCVLRLQYGQSMYAGSSRSRSRGVTYRGSAIGSIADVPPDGTPWTLFSGVRPAHNLKPCGLIELQSTSTFVDKVKCAGKTACARTWSAVGNIDI